jgi:hypothetical protein
MNVANHSAQILVSIDQNRLVPSTKERPVAAVAAVESLRVKPIDVPDDTRQISFRGSQTHMVVVPHQAISERLYASDPVGLSQHVQKRSVIVVPNKSRLPRRTPVHNMVHRSLVLYL